MLLLPESQIELAMADGVEPADKKKPNEHWEIEDEHSTSPRRRKSAQRNRKG